MKKALLLYISVLLSSMGTVGYIQLHPSFLASFCLAIAFISLTLTFIYSDTPISGNQSGGPSFSRLDLYIGIIFVWGISLFLLSTPSLLILVKTGVFLLSCLIALFGCLMGAFIKHLSSN